MSDRHPFIPCAACGRGTGIQSVPICHLIFCDGACRDNYIVRSVELSQRSVSLRGYFVALLRNALSRDRQFLSRLGSIAHQQLELSDTLTQVFASPIDSVSASRADRLQQQEDAHPLSCRIAHRDLPRHRAPVIPIRSAA